MATLRFAGRGAAPAPQAAPSRGGMRGGGAPIFQYVPRSAAVVAQRAQGGDDFDKFLDVPKVWKPKDGMNTVRILPPTWPGALHWGLDVRVHYGVGPDRQSYLCLHKQPGLEKLEGSTWQSSPCPVCEERAEAQRAGDEAYAKELDARTRVVVFLVDRDAEGDGVQAYAMPQGSDRDLVKVVVDPRTQDVLSIDDPYHGFDVSFSKSGQGIKTKYEGMQVARRETALNNDDALRYIQDHPIPDVLVFFSYAHILAEFSGGGASESSGAAEATPERGRGRTPAPTPQDSGPEVTWEYVHALASQELDALCAELPELSGINPAEAKDDEDLMAWICEVLHLVEPAAPPPPPPASVRRGVAPAPAPEAGGAVQRMRLTRR